MHSIWFQYAHSNKLGNVNAQIQNKAIILQPLNGYESYKIMKIAKNYNYDITVHHIFVIAYNKKYTYKNKMCLRNTDAPNINNVKTHFFIII